MAAAGTRDENIRGDIFSCILIMLDGQRDYYEGRLSSAEVPPRFAVVITANKLFPSPALVALDQTTGFLYYPHLLRSHSRLESVKV